MSPGESVAEAGFLAQVLTTSLPHSIKDRHRPGDAAAPGSGGLRAQDRGAGDGRGCLPPAGASTHARASMEHRHCWYVLIGVSGPFWLKDMGKKMNSLYIFG